MHTRTSDKHSPIKTKPMKPQKFASRLLVASGALFSVIVATAQPVISNFYPNGTNLFQSSATFSFAASSSSTITNLEVDLIAKPLVGSQVLQVLTPGNGLNVTGLPGGNITANCALNSNFLYSVTIKATDNSGKTNSTTIQSVAFDTIIPAYTWEAEDFDYTNGLYFDNPQSNAYAGRAGASGVDYNDGATLNSEGHSYRPDGTSGGYGGLATENCGDTPRISHLGFQDYDVGWNDGGYWGNYTRHYPTSAGAYYVFMRGSSTSQQQRNADLSVVAGTGVLTGSGTLAFRVPLTGANQTYAYGPLLDANNNYVTFTPPTDGSTTALKVAVDQGNYNANFYLLMPTNIYVAQQGSITFSNFYPDGKLQMEDTNQFVFTAGSSVGVNPGSVILQVTATNLQGQGSVQLLGANGLTITGQSTNLSASLGLTGDTIYSIFIQATDSNGAISTTNITFDTVNPNYYQFESEDFNYQGGQYIDNPQVDQYIDFDGGPAGSGQYDGIDMVDDHYTGNGARNDDRLQLATGTQNGEPPRPQYNVEDPNYPSWLQANNGTSNYMNWTLNNTTSGEWGNYTRHFPLGTYNIYVRGERGSSGIQNDSGSIGIVSGDPTTTAQTNTVLGTFNGPPTGNWGVGAWTPVKAPNGSLVELTITNSPITLRETVDNGGFNLDCVMLVPANAGTIEPPYINNFTPDGSTFFQESAQLSFVAHSQIGVTAANITMILNGINVSGGLVGSGSPNTLNVSYPVQTNKFYTAIVTVKDAYGTTTSTNSFDTFDYNSTYIFQAEDYDYSGGQFIDNPAPGGYAGLGGILDVDDSWDYNQGAGYRPSAGAGEGLATEQPSGDSLLPSYNGDNTYDYDVGHNDGGNWANYTHTYPAGKYNIYMRVASPNSAAANNAAKVSIVTGGWGTTSQTIADMSGTFGYPDTGDWHKYSWAPLVDSGGNLVQWNSPGTTNTLRVTVVNGGYNVNFYALVPADTNIPSIGNIYPNGTNQFQSSGSLSFTASSAAGISSNSISVQLTGTNLFGQVFTTNLSAGNGLTFSGSMASWNASLNLAANTFYSAVITATSLNGEQTTFTVTFDTVNPSMTFEGEDWNYTDANSGTAGLFINNPQTNGYANLPSTPGVDFNNVNTNQGSPTYRPFGLATENCNDTKRAQYATLQDYDVGNVSAGDWANYTRIFSPGVYNIYMRAANGGGTNQSYSDSASLYLVTSTATTTNQTTLKMGTFSVPATGGWQTYTDVPLIDPDGNYAEFVGGSQETLRIAIDNGYCNQNYYLLVPAESVLPVNPPRLYVAQSGTNTVISFLSRTNTTYVLESTTNLTIPTWTPVSTNSGTALWMSITNGIGSGAEFYHLKLQ